MNKKFVSSLNNLSNFISYVESFLKDANCSDSIINKILISCEEIFLNICKYAYNSEHGDIFLDIRLNMGKIVIEIQDFGIPFDPLSYVSKKVNETKKSGGLGILLVRRLMDDIKYLRDDNKNILIIIKNMDGDKL